MIFKVGKDNENITHTYCNKINIILLILFYFILKVPILVHQNLVLLFLIYFVYMFLTFQ